MVSPDGEKRDYEEKRAEYAAANIPEYWVVDPLQKEFLVLRLSGNQYVDTGPLRPGDVAKSAVLQGFQIDVGQCFSEMTKASPHDDPPSVND